MTTSYTARPHAATADWRPQGHWATNLMNVRSSCLSELFREHPLLQLARAVYSTATLGCHRGSSLRHPKMLPTGTKAVPCVSPVQCAPRARPGSVWWQVPPVTEPVLAHSNRHNNRLLSHRSFYPQKCRIGYSQWFPPRPVPMLAPVICREISARRASAPAPVPGRAVFSVVPGLGDSRSPSGAGTLVGRAPMATGQR